MSNENPLRILFKDILSKRSPFFRNLTRELRIFRLFILRKSLEKQPFDIYRDKKNVYVNIT